MELANLPEQKERAMTDLLRLLQIDVMAPLEKRFEYAATLWEAVSPAIC